MESAPLANAMIYDTGYKTMHCIQSTPDYSLWFLVGSMSAIVIYLIISMIKEWKRKK